MVRQRAAAGPPAPGLVNVTRTQLLFNWHPQQHYEFITFCFSGEALSLPGQLRRYVSLLKPRSIHRRGGRAIIAATLFWPGLFFRRLLDGLGLDLLTGTCGFAYLRPASAGLSAFAHSASVSSPWPLALAQCKGRRITSAGKMTICPIKHSRCCTAILQLYGDRL